MTDPLYRRYARIEKTDQAGALTGILATDGEAADGHILSIRGAEAKAPAPLLFGHDAGSGRGNLGSWTSFDVMHGKKLGDSQIRGFASIELEGAGEQKDWRSDIAHMVAQGHIRAFSVRWEPTEKPTRRINLPENHPAFIPEDGPEPQRWGLFFPKWRLLEGSVVTLGADPKALIGRALEGPRGLAIDWLRATADCLAFDPATPLGEVLGRAGPDPELLLEANARLIAAIDLHLASVAMRDAPPAAPRVDVEVATPPPTVQPKEPEKRTPAPPAPNVLTLLDCLEQLSAKQDQKFMAAFDATLGSRLGRVA